MGNPILSLSGGNQRKCCSPARSPQAEIVLMDDPMRGVDIGTKQGLCYPQTRAEAGRTFIWYSTEMDEICLCDRVYVFRDGAIVAELTDEEIDESHVLAASFSGEQHEGSVDQYAQARHPGGFAGDPACRGVLHPAACHELYRAQPAVQPRGSDRARHHRADADHGGQRSRPVDRNLRELRGLRDGRLHADGAGNGNRHPCRSGADLCCARHHHPPA